MSLKSLPAMLPIKRCCSQRKPTFSVAYLLNSQESLTYAAWYFPLLFVTP